MVTKICKAVVLCLLAFSCHGCMTKVIHLESSPAFAAIRSKTFVLKKDAYIFREGDQKRNSGMFIGCVAMEPGIRIPGFPERVDSSLVGKQYRDIQIFGIVPMGTSFHIVGLKRIVTYETTLTSFEIQLNDDQWKKWGVLDGFWITDDSNFDYPQIKSALAK